jgi:hypothetical protein
MQPKQGPLSIFSAAPEISVHESDLARWHYHSEKILKNLAMLWTSRNTHHRDGQQPTGALETSHRGGGSGDGSRKSPKTICGYRRSERRR